MSSGYYDYIRGDNKKIAATGFIVLITLSSAISYAGFLQGIFAGGEGSLLDIHVFTQNLVGTPTPVFYVGEPVMIVSDISHSGASSDPGQYQSYSNYYAYFDYFEPSGYFDYSDYNYYGYSDYYAYQSYSQYSDYDDYSEYSSYSDYHESPDPSYIPYKVIMTISDSDNTPIKIKSMNTGVKEGDSKTTIFTYLQDPDTEPGYYSVKVYAWSDWLPEGRALAHMIGESTIEIREAH